LAKMSITIWLWPSFAPACEIPGLEWAMCIRVSFVAPKCRISSSLFEFSAAEFAMAPLLRMKTRRVVEAFKFSSCFLYSCVAELLLIVC